MYIKMQEVTLIHESKYRPQEGDGKAYKRELNGETVFTSTGEQSRFDTIMPTLFGAMYIDTDNNVCIVPNVWNETDALCARRAVWPDPSPE